MPETYEEETVKDHTTENSSLQSAVPILKTYSVTHVGHRSVLYREESTKEGK